MKRKIFIAVMIIFTAIIAVTLFISLICGAPMNSAGLLKYVFCAIGISILLPAGFTVFFIITLDLSEQLEEYEKDAVSDEKEKDSEITDNIPIPALVNALAKKKNLTPEEKERLLSYLEDL